MTSLVDADVLIEILRGSQPSRSWLDSIRNDAFEVPGIVAMEVVAGCRDAVEMIRCRKLLGGFVVAWPSETECREALEILAVHKLKCGLSIPDCFIAAMAVARRSTLYTFNLRHFRTVPDLDCRQPYERNPASA